VDDASGAVLRPALDAGRRRDAAAAAGAGAAHLLRPAHHPAQPARVSDRVSFVFFVSFCVF